MRILIADDSAIMREHLGDALSGLENVRIAGVASDGNQALELIHTLDPDVVILDIRMPHRSGIDVLERIRKENHRPVVIVFTNYPFPQYRKKCEQAGADYFFDKSSESHRVIATLESLAKDSRFSGQ